MPSESLGLFVEIQTACGDEQEARKIATAVVEKHLAACVHVFPITSIYRWKGGIETGNEWLCVIKTTHKRFPAIRDAVRQMHSYECPQIVMLPIIDGEKNYLDWLSDQVNE
ncbi:MAG: divalent-cation tolerance protein CutA [Planctomycetaceae bacterium]|jgi:periplasmic divalent cation tolerance protein|nr:divalent-cation tolerance protein CutA [Planctomycetaceae bacterium]